jgi:hypothetical protein
LIECDRRSIRLGTDPPHLLNAELEEAVLNAELEAGATAIASALSRLTALQTLHLQ